MQNKNVQKFPIWAFSKIVDTCFKCGKKSKWYMQLGKDFICFYKMPMKPPQEKEGEIIGGLCTKDYVDMVKKVEGRSPPPTKVRGVRAR